MTFTVTIPVWAFALIGGLTGVVILGVSAICARDLLYRILGGGKK